jgi:hypothetical protein
VNGFDVTCVAPYCKNVISEMIKTECTVIFFSNVSIFCFYMADYNCIFFI